MAYDMGMDTIDEQTQATLGEPDFQVCLDCAITYVNGDVDDALPYLGDVVICTETSEYMGQATNWGVVRDCDACGVDFADYYPIYRKDSI